MRWQPNRHNIAEYKDICRTVQRRERQLKRERKRKNTQRIQANPEAEISIALKKQKDTRKRQIALDKTTGLQMAPKAFALHIKSKIDILEDAPVELNSFDVDEERVQRNIPQQKCRTVCG